MQSDTGRLHSAKACVTEPYGSPFYSYFVVTCDALADTATTQAVIGIWCIPSGIHVYHHLFHSFSLSCYLVVKMRYALVLHSSVARDNISHGKKYGASIMDR